MPYPIHILPISDYKRIEGYEKGYLIRHTSTKDLIDAETGKIRVEFICSPKEGVLDLSVSLMGVFTTNDTNISIIGNKKDYYLSEWVDQTTPEVPQEHTDYFEDNNRGFFFLSMSIITDNNVVIVHQNELTLKYICKIEHTPLNWNFWHYSIRWYNEHGEALKKGSKTALNRLRNMLSEYAMTEKPVCETIPHTFYVKNKEVLHTKKGCFPFFRSRK